MGYTFGFHPFFHPSIIKDKAMTEKITAEKKKIKIMKGTAKNRTTDVQIVSIERMIFVMRKHRVILDSDLADLYGVLTKR